MAGWRKCHSIGFCQWHSAGASRRYQSNVILAYTLQAGEQGYISIANSSFLTPGGSGTNYSIFVDNTQIGSTVSVNAGTTTSFNQGLGYLNAGQTKVDPNHWTVFCRFLASEIPQGLSLVSVTQA